MRAKKLNIVNGEVMKVKMEEPRVFNTQITDEDFEVVLEFIYFLTRIIQRKKSSRKVENMVEGRNS